MISIILFVVLWRESTCQIFVELQRFRDMSMQPTDNIVCTRVYIGETIEPGYEFMATNLSTVWKYTMHTVNVDMACYDVENTAVHICWITSTTSDSILGRAPLRISTYMNVGSYKLDTIIPNGINRQLPVFVHSILPPPTKHLPFDYCISSCNSMLSSDAYVSFRCKTSNGVFINKRVHREVNTYPLDEGVTFDTPFIWSLDVSPTLAERDKLFVIQKGQELLIGPPPGIHKMCHVIINNTCYIYISKSTIIVDTSIYENGDIVTVEWQAQIQPVRLKPTIEVLFASMILTDFKLSVAIPMMIHLATSKQNVDADAWDWTVLGRKNQISFVVYDTSTPANTFKFISMYILTPPLVTILTVIIYKEIKI